jgi:hypothetical protein
MLNRLAPSLTNIAKSISYSLDKFRFDPQKNRPQLENVERDIYELRSVAKALENNLKKLKAAAEDD